MECLGKPMNHRSPAFFSVVEKARHIIMSKAPNNSIVAWNPSRCSYGSVDPSYALRLVGYLKMVGTGVVIMS